MTSSVRLASSADLYVGSTVGLWPGKHRIEGGGTYEADAHQKWLYECWQDAVAEIQSLDGPMIGVLNGDAIRGVNMRDGELVTTKFGFRAYVTPAWATQDGVRPQAGHGDLAPDRLHPDRVGRHRPDGQAKGVSLAAARH